MPKAEAKQAVKFTRMCRFWRTNECRMGVDCTFAHSTGELRPSPKPCFDFVKTGFCGRGESCRFVHEDVKKSKKLAALQQEALTMPDQLGQFMGPGVMPPYMTVMGQYSQEFAMPTRQMYSAMEPVDVFNPPPGLEQLGQGGRDPMPIVPAQDAQLSRESSSSDFAFGLDSVPMTFLKADVERSWALESTVATQSLTSNFCQSATPSNFSESDSPTGTGTSFWL
mmetsp:Transcript_32408/g.61021  ORF Transcript_32408/g.61021 Transcript_32408/m.61021 type:complete len:224 (-) Transcript_32408:38-709(-)